MSMDLTPEVDIGGGSPIANQNDAIVGPVVDIRDGSIPQVAASLPGSVGSPAAQPSTFVGSVDFLKPYGGDFVQDGTGDWVVIADDDKSAPATEQRLAYMMETVPQETADDGSSTLPDDMFHPNWGLGIGRFVDEMVTVSSDPADLATDDTLVNIERELLASVAVIPAIAQIDVEFEVNGDELSMNVFGKTKTGANIAVSRTLQ